MRQKSLLYRFMIIYFLIFFTVFRTYTSKKININRIIKNNYSYKEKYDEIVEDYELIKSNYEFIPAQIININNKKINNIAIINKGLKNNINENAFVVNNKGLIGEIVKVYKRYSIVRLINSNNSNIAVEINDCYGSLNNHIVTDLINCNNVSINDTAYTSKYNYSSSNIKIGTVEKINKDKIFIKYSFNPYELRYVGVINDINWLLFYSILKYSFSTISILSYKKKKKVLFLCFVWFDNWFITIKQIF